MNTLVTAKSLSRLLAALALSLGSIALVMGPLSGELWPLTHLLFAPITTIAYALVGVLIAIRQPRNPIGWLFSIEGVCAALTSLVGDGNYHWFCQDRMPCTDIGRWLSIWIWMPTTLVPMSFVLLLFPNGRLPSRRWRPIAWVAGVGLGLLIVVNALHPHPPTEPVPPENPFGIPGIVPYLDQFNYVAWILVMVGVFGALAALVVRFRRSRSIEREQIKWLAYGSSLSILFLILLAIWSFTRPDDRVANEITIGGVWVVLTVIVIASGIAILRHRLYDIDLIINRTLVYGALSAGVVGLYVLLVGTLGALFQSSGNFMIALLATGLAALLAQPLRERLQRAVNRLMYGERDDPYTVLSGLSQQLKTSLAPSTVLPSIAEAVAKTLKLPYVALQLAYGNQLELAVAYGRPAGEPLRLPLVYQAETVGELLVAPRAPGELFTASERRLLDDIALQAGVAAHAVRLSTDLQRARERLVNTREEERRRLRRDLHDGLGPQLASLTLTVAAARELLRHDVEAADRLLQELSAHTQSAITDIRRVVYDLRPPALDDLGLVLALREQATSYSQAGLQITIDAPDCLPPLPAAVEVAAYRIVQEALTNVVRHARARSCTVRIVLDAALLIEVRDDGIGLPATPRAGVGMTSMRERVAELGGECTITSLPAQETRIVARLPVPGRTV